jgi:serine/threonine protein kinase/DNA-binding beta-propeller fold protein YncE
MRARLAGKYELDRQIGMGGMGRVFEAVDLESGRRVAAKVMIAGSEFDLQALLRFQQEGAVLSTLKHPNIVAVYGTFLEGETCAIIMELLDGRPLRALMQDGPLPLARIKVLVEQVLAALAYAHARGIIHRDVKPDNIMVAPDDHVKVTDFGIARILAPGGTLNTRTGTSIGTPLYMSPEQIEGQKVDGRSDLYSLGTVMYHMAAGRPPFEGDDPLTVAFQHVHKAPPPPSELNGEIPDDWEEIILRSLAKTPAERYQTADALREAISYLSTTPATGPRTPRGKPDTIERIISPELTGDTESPTDSVAAAPPTAARTVSFDLPRLRWPLVAAGVVVLAALLFALSRLIGGGGNTSHAAAGTLLTSWGGRGSGPGQLTAPSGIAVGSDGTVYVADYDNNRISSFSPTGTPLHQWPLRDPRTGQAISASAGALARSGLDYLVDPNLSRILTLSSRGVVHVWRTPVKLLHPSSIALSPTGNIYVVDQGHNRVVELGPHGRVIAHFGGTGSAPGRFQYPTSIAVAPNGEVFVTDQANYRVQGLGPRGRPIVSWGGPHQFPSLSSVAVDRQGRVYVTDSHRARVQVFTPHGRLLAGWGTQGSKRGELKEPAGIALDAQGNVYVVDFSNNTVLKYAPVQ